MLAVTNISENTQFAKYNSTPKFVDLQYFHDHNLTSFGTENLKFTIIEFSKGQDKYVFTHMILPHKKKKQLMKGKESDFAHTNSTL